MAKFLKVLRTAYATKIENRSKITFFFFFFLTRIMNFSLRRFPHFGKFLKKTFSHLPKVEFIIKNSLGRWAVFPFDDTMTISSEYFEEELKDWPSKVVNRRIFLDIGANIGRYTLLAANNFNYSKVMSIEANPITSSILKKNINLNNLGSRVVVEQTAVSNKDGEVTIQYDSHHLGGGNIVDYHIHPENMDNKIQVPLTTVDSLISKNNLNPQEVDFVKIDVEGMEVEVLEGMSSVLDGMPEKSAIMIEISNESKVMEILTKYGFKRVESISNDNLFLKGPKI